MKQKAGKIIIGVLLLAILSGCSSNSEQADTYVAGTDYQYMYGDGGSMSAHQAKGEDGYYLLAEKFVYYINDSMDTVVPLCSKIDCLHNEETDGEKQQQCNAYVENDGMVQISYCDGYLYYICCINEQYQLHRMKEDGSSKEKIKEWDDCLIKQWIVHRNTIYYVNVDYTIGDNGMMEEHYSLKSLSLKGRLKEKYIYTPDEEIEVMDLANPVAYGNHLYFEVLGYTVDSNKITDDNYQDYLYAKTFEYNLEDETLHEIIVDEKTHVQGVTFWQDKIILNPFDFNKDYGENAKSYIANLDGSNMKEFAINTVQGEKFLSDGTYLYVNNQALVALDKTSEFVYKVYDNNSKLIDTMSVPFEGTGGLEIGDEKGAFIVVVDEGNKSTWELRYLDKSKFGTYQGQPFDTLKIDDVKYMYDDGINHNISGEYLGEDMYYTGE